MTRSKGELIAENALLRQQTIILQRRTKRPQLTQHDRGLWVVLARWARRWKDALAIVKPDTLLGGHRQGFRLYWRHKSRTTTWVARQLREATPFGAGPKYLVRDNDDKFGAQFKLVAAGISILETPVRAPKANAICERFLSSIRRECLDHFLILSERHLQRIVTDYVTCFNQMRPHQGIGQQSRHLWGKLYRSNHRGSRLRVCRFWAAFITPVRGPLDRPIHGEIR